MYGLDWRDVDLDERILRIRRGKNGEGRYAHLNSMALAALAKLRERSDGTGPVIRNLAGAPLLRPRHWFERSVRLADVQDFHWHDLRHTFASRLAMAGVGLAVIQRALGHKSIVMTTRYAHLTEGFMLQAVEKLVPWPAETRSAQRTGAKSDDAIEADRDLKAVLVH